MNILDQIYEINFTKINFMERKVSIKNPYSILIGPPKSGKTYLIYDYLSEFDFDRYLYIDLSDYRNNKNEVFKYLDAFIQEKEIEVLVVENFQFDFELPKVEHIIISTDKKRETFDKRFDLLEVFPLDFEEYLLFDHKHNNLSNSFNSFLKFGSFPEIIEYSEQKKIQRNLEICKLYCEDRTYLEILFILIKFAGEQKSVFQLFNTLKKDIKISKDKFYKVFDEFVSNKLLFLCEKYGQPKALKKIYIFNHALIDMVSYKKNFNNLFKNMVYLELIRQYETVYYLDNIDFYLPETKQIILAIPFFNSLVSSTIISKIIPILNDYEVEVITIITVSTEQSVFIDEIEALALPFYNWVLTL
jgi:uncharacterized protein